MADEPKERRKPPELKVVDEATEVHRLGEQSPPRKKAHLRRSKEESAISRDLAQEVASAQSSDTSTDESTLAPEFEATPAPALRIPPAFIALAAIGFLALLGGGIFLVAGGQTNTHNLSARKEIEANKAAAEKEMEDARAMLASLTTAVKSYTSAKTIAEKLAFARQPERVKGLMQKWYQDHELTPNPGATLVSQYPLPIKDRSFVILTVAFDDRPDQLYLSEVDNDLNVRIDWESDVCYQPVDLADYIANKPTNPTTLRVLARPDNFYVYEFSDYDMYQCLRLSFRDSDEILYGYVERESIHSKRLARHFRALQQSGSYQPEPMLLTVEFPENPRSENGVLVTDFIAPRWANIDEFSDDE